MTAHQSGPTRPSHPSRLLTEGYATAEIGRRMGLTNKRHRRQGALAQAGQLPSPIGSTAQERTFSGIMLDLWSSPSLILGLAS